jgi:hypothetical protein
MVLFRYLESRFSEDKMKIQKVSRWFSFLLFMTAVAGCSQLIENVATSSPVASVLPDSSASLTETLAPTLTLVPTGTQTQLLTPIAVPSLSVEDARKRLLGLLATNGDCRLPCLWGITPGKSDYQKARNILMPLSSVAETAHFASTSPVDDVSPLYVEGDLHLNTRVAYLYDSNGIVSRLTFRAFEEKVTTDSNGNWISKTPIYDSPTFKKRVEYYSLSHLLSEQGIPASVMISTESPSQTYTGIIGVDIVLLYPDQGIWAKYTTSMDESIVGSSIRSCPANAHIELNLYPPGDSDSFTSLLEETEWGVTKNGYKPLEEATSMSVEEFYQIFRNPTDKCIETPTNLWPTPES